MALKLETEYDPDELVSPKWLDSKFFTQILQDCEHDANIKVVDLILSPAAPKGDHFASIMFRAKVRYQQENAEKIQSMIVKIMPELDGFRKDLFTDLHIFETEIGMYTEVIPKCETILREVGDDTVLAPLCLYHSLSPKKCIIFEDLAPQGYTVKHDINLEEAKLAYMKLAKMQAISYKLSLENPEFFDKYHHTFLTSPNVLENNFVTDGIKNFIHLLDTIPTLRKYTAYFEAMQSNLVEKCIASTKEFKENRQNDTIYVIGHGDFHYKNIMLKWSKESDALEDVMLIDFQMSCMTPLAHDLLYSLYLLVDAQLRLHHRDEILYFYFTHFLETLKKIGFKGSLPKITELREQIVQQKHYEMYLLTTHLPLWLAIRDKTDYTEVLCNTDAQNAAYQNQAYIAELEECLPRFLQLGYFDD